MMARVPKAEWTIGGRLVECGASAPSTVVTRIVFTMAAVPRLPPACPAHSECIERHLEPRGWLLRAQGRHEPGWAAPGGSRSRAVAPPSCTGDVRSGGVGVDGGSIQMSGLSVASGSGLRGEEEGGEDPQDEGAGASVGRDRDPARADHQYD